MEGWKWFFKARNTILIHAAFWLALIFAYPKFPQVQAIFFWNPWVRKILGVGYVGFLLTWVPYLGRKLFEPFKPSLLADAGIDNFTSLAYFPESQVKLPGSEEIKPITEALPSIQGQIVLEGDSGLGKSMFLRHLVTTSPQIVVHLPAQKCDSVCRRYERPYSQRYICAVIADSMMGWIVDFLPKYLRIGQKLRTYTNFL